MFGILIRKSLIFGMLFLMPELAFLRLFLSLSDFDAALCKYWQMCDRFNLSQTEVSSPKKY